MKPTEASERQPGAPTTPRPLSKASARHLAEKLQIQEALYEAATTHASHPDPLNGEDAADRLTASFLIVEIFDLVTEMTRSNRVIFYHYSTNKRGSKTPHPDAPMLGTRVINALRGIYGNLHRAFAGHRAHPLIEAFCLEAERRGLPDTIFSLNSLATEAANQVIDQLNEFVACIREKSKSIEVRKRIKNHLRSSQKNERELSRYIDTVFLHYSRVMVLRIDLGYKKSYGIKFSESPYALLDEATSHREKLLKRARETILKDSWIGYAWKLEYGPEKRFHYHLLILLNGAHVRQDVSIARLVGEYWENEVTQGNGVYFNCNAKKRQYIHRGIGVIDYTDQAARNALKTWVISYLCKRDKYISHFLQGGKRTFGKGEMLKPRKTAVGRPRVTENR